MDKTLPNRMQYFMQNYDVAYTYVHDKGETQYIDDLTRKVCRFCGRRYPEVKFKKKAHAVSELLGNKEFVLRNECDDCNERFGRLLEDELSKYLGLSRTISQIHGKNGVPTYRSRDKKKRIEFDENLGIVIKVIDDSLPATSYGKDTDDNAFAPTVDSSKPVTDKDLYSDGFTEKIGNTLVIHAVREKYTPIAVYKAFVKMALSLLPYKFMPSFIETVDWIKEPSHIISKYNDLDQYGIMLEKFIPGVPFIPMRATGFIRKNDTIDAPYYQFYIEFANFSYQIAVPCPVKDRYLKDITLTPVPGADDEIEMMEFARLIEQGFQPNEPFESEYRKRFGQPQIKAQDMRSNQKVVDEPLDIALGFTGFESGAGNGQTVDEFLASERERLK